MTITKPCVVALTWTLRDAQDQVIDTLEEATEFLFGGDDLLPKIEEAIEGQSAGFTAKLHLEPEHAFGEYDASLVFFEQRSDLPGDIEVGMQFEGPPPGAKTAGLREDTLYTVTEAYPEHVVLDGNHPLAGIALRIDLRVAAVREASEQEIESGSVGEPLLALAPGAPPSGTPLH
jgi:FKBP-type peptidyl-prolyl cis-trans isomerase SlyD